MFLNKIQFLKILERLRILIANSQTELAGLQKFFRKALIKNQK